MLSEIKKVVSLYFEPLKKLFQFRVKRWHTAMRGWDEKDIRVLICLEDLIWYWMVLEWLFWDNGTYICHWLHYVPLPRFIRNWERHWDKDDPEYFASSKIGSVTISGVCGMSTSVIRCANGFGSTRISRRHGLSGN